MLYRCLSGFRFEQEIISFSPYGQAIRGPNDLGLYAHRPGRNPHQNIYDNVTLLDEALLRQINDVIVEVGHQVFKKKEADALRFKTDSFVVETDVHFPTDYNLLWDSARKCIDIAGRLPVAGWRKGKHWKRTLKGLMRTVGKISARGGPNKKKRLQAAVSAYLSKACVH